MNRLFHILSPCRFSNRMEKGIAGSTKQVRSLRTQRTLRELTRLRINRPVLALVTLICAAVVPTVSGQFFKPDAVVEGKTIPQWVEENINWDIFLLSQNPPLDTVNVHPDNLDSVMNDGPVYFIDALDFDNPNSTLLVPQGRPILQRVFQIFDTRHPQEVDANGVPVALSGNPANGELQLPDPGAHLEAIAKLVDSIGPFFWEYDGVEFSQDEINTHRVELLYNAIVPENFFDVPMGEYPMSPEVGFWLMHEPFDPGEQHTVKLGGLTPEGVRFPEFTVQLVALPEAGAMTNLDLLITDIKLGHDLKFDFTGDRQVDVSNLLVFVTSPDYLNTYIGDSNLDGEFNSLDFVIVFRSGEYEDGISMNSTWSTGDWNADGEFDTGDLIFAFKEGGFEQGPRTAVNNVPEPSSLFLAILGIAAARNRRFASNHRRIRHDQP